MQFMFGNAALILDWLSARGTVLVEFLVQIFGGQ